MAIHLYRVILPVKDLEAAASFYSRVFRTPGERVSPGRHYFDCGGTILACYDPAADGDDVGDGWHHHTNQYLYFSVPDLEDVIVRVREAGGKIRLDIDTMPWGERMFYASDPFGNPISFVDESTLFTGSSRPEITELPRRTREILGEVMFGVSNMVSGMMGYAHMISKEPGLTDETRELLRRAMEYEGRFKDLFLRIVVNAGAKPVDSE